MSISAIYKRNTQNKRCVGLYVIVFVFLKACRKGNGKVNPPDWLIAKAFSEDWVVSFDEVSGGVDKILHFFGWLVFRVASCN